MLVSLVTPIFFFFNFFKTVLNILIIYFKDMWFRIKLLLMSTGTGRSYYSFYIDKLYKKYQILMFYDGLIGLGKKAFC